MEQLERKKIFESLEQSVDCATERVADLLRNTADDVFQNLLIEHVGAVLVDKTIRDRWIDDSVEYLRPLVFARLEKSSREFNEAAEEFLKKIAEKDGEEVPAGNN